MELSSRQDDWMCVFFISMAYMRGGKVDIPR
jgi:hypothetical protein